MNTRDKYIYDGAKKVVAKNINPYLVDAPYIIITSRSKPICNVPEMTYGNKPSDGGNLILSPDERNELISKEPHSEIFIKKYIGSVEFINNKERYCLWLQNIPYNDVKKCTSVLERIEKVRTFRLSSSAKPTVEKAGTPHLFFSITQPNTKYLVIPEVSSENRRYIPIGYLMHDVIPSNKLCIIPTASLYHFGILTSNVHMAWTRAICGRMKSDYQYSKSIVYNNFPWPESTEEQQQKIEKLAHDILNARLLYSDSSLADMYGNNSMPFYPELVKAHKSLDRAVMSLYGFSIKDTTEAVCVASLMERYQILITK